MTTVEDIRTNLNAKLEERRRTMEEQIRVLQEKQAFYDGAVRTLSELLPEFEKPLNKLHLELVDARVNYAHDSGSSYYVIVNVRTKEGFRYITSRGYDRMYAKSERLTNSLLKALGTRGVSYVNINPFSLQGGVGGYTVGDTFDIQITIDRQ